jgi:hypothetical protein
VEPLEIGGPVRSHGPPDAPSTMTLCGNGNRKKKKQAKDVKAWVKHDSKDEQERSFGIHSAFVMPDGHRAWTSHGEGDEAMT